LNQHEIMMILGMMDKSQVIDLVNDQTRHDIGRILFGHLQNYRIFSGRRNGQTTIGFRLSSSIYFVMNDDILPIRPEKTKYYFVFVRHR